MTQSVFVPPPWFFLLLDFISDTTMFSRVTVVELQGGEHGTIFDGVTMDQGLDLAPSRACA